MPPDQPAPPVPEVQSTREHEEAAIRWASAVMTGAPDLRIYEVQQLASLLASRDVAAEARGRRLERERVVSYLDGAAACHEDGSECANVLLAAAFQIACGDHLAQPKESATPAVEGPALERPCPVCGGDGEEPICGWCAGSGKEPT